MGSLRKNIKKNKQMKLVGDSQKKLLSFNPSNTLLNSLVDGYLKADNQRIKNVFNGKIKDVNMSPTCSLPAVTSYGDSEGNEDLIKEAMNLSLLQRNVREAFFSSSISGIKNGLESVKNKMDYLLNRYPRIFASYGTYGSVYYTYLGMLNTIEDNINKARENYIRGLIYEMIYLSRCIKKENENHVRNWMKNGLGNLNNYNTLVEKTHRLNNPFMVCTYADIAKIYIEFLLVWEHTEELSQHAVSTYCKYIRNMLQIHYSANDYEKNYKDDLEKILGALQDDCIVMNASQWDVVVECLIRINDKVNAVGKIEELVSKFMKMEVTK